MGPLQGIKIVEFAGLGPGPMAAMLLADLGATVLRIERPQSQPTSAQVAFEIVKRNREAITLDLKVEADRQLALDLVAKADALIEGFRPGVMERLGLGPEQCILNNARLVYCRATGWGQTGPLSTTAGHDLNYIALSGALEAIGRAGQPPTPPLNLVGDYGGGALYLALGLVSAVLEAKSSGQGQVVDVAMIDGATSLMAKFYGLWASGVATGTPVGPRGTNLLDSGAYFYDVYQCACEKWLSVAAIETPFHAQLIELLRLPGDWGKEQWDAATWPARRDTLAKIFRTQTRDEWMSHFSGTDACVAPVLSVGDAPFHEHMKARHTLIEVDGVQQPAPAPRFSRTALTTPTPPRPPDLARERVLSDWGL